MAAATVEGAAHPAGEKAENTETSGSPASVSALPENFPPNLVNMSSVVWEEMLSFLPPSSISTASHRISKTLGANDKANSSERAAKLALENMMMKAWKEAELTYDGVAANDDYCDGHSTTSMKELLAIDQFEDESFLRTYQLASVMIRVRDGERKKEAIVARMGVSMKSAQNGALHTVMWLIFGRPALPPLAEVGYEIAAEMADSLAEVLGPPPDNNDGGWVSTKEQRLESKETFKKFCHRRILLFVERLGKIGMYNAAFLFLSMLAFDSPHLRNCDHIFHAEYYIGSQVVLQGLSRTELNGTTSIVEKLYNRKNGRIGVTLTDKATGNTRIVGIKAGNLDLLEADTTIVIDAKIMMGETLFRSIQSIEDYRPHCMPSIVHMLRGVVAKLREKVGRCEKDRVLDEEPPGGDSSHFSTDTHRLFYAECYLGFLIATVAKYVTMELVPRDFGGLTCEHHDQVLALALDDDFVDENEVEATKTVAIAQYYLQESACGLQRCGKILHSLSRREKVQEGEEDIQPMLLLRSLAHGTLHEVAGFLSEGLGCAFIPLNRLTESIGSGEHAERTSKEHIMVAVACMRSMLEFLFETYAKVGSEPGHLTVDLFCSNILPQVYAVYLAELAFAIAETYFGTNTMWDNDTVFPGGECEDREMLIKLALLVSARSLGCPHPMTRRIGRECNVTAWAGQRAYQDAEEAVDEWLKDYIPLYIGTSREHPALFRQLTAGVEYSS